MRYFTFSFFLLLSLPLFAQIDERAIKNIFSGWDSPDTPGYSLVIFHEKEIYKKSSGLADLEHEVRITSESVFDIASLSKQFTAFCILLLEERKALSLDDDIRIYLPELPDYGALIR